MTVTPTKILDAVATNNANTSTFTLTGTAAVGDTLVAFFNTPTSGAATGSSFTDSKGNTWTVRATELGSMNSGKMPSVATCKVTTALTTSDTVTPKLEPGSMFSSNWLVQVWNLGVIGAFDAAAHVDVTTATGAPSVSLGAAARENHQFVMAAFVYTNTTHSPFIVGSGYTLGPTTINGTGSGARNLTTEYAEPNVAGTRSAGGAFTGTAASFSAVIVSFAADPPAAATMNAGADQADVEPGGTVTLNSSASTGVTSGRTWSQRSGAAVTLSSTSATSPTFTAPPTLAGSTLVFRVTDNASGSFDEVSIAVLPASRRVKLGGVMVPTYKRYILP